MLRSLQFLHAAPLTGGHFQVRAKAQGVGAHLEVAAVLVGGFLLRVGLLSRPGLHPDEALYASWALRIADGRDPALLGVLVDKPPLLPYLLAGLFRLIGQWGPATGDLGTLVIGARLAAIGVGVVSLALLWVIACQVGGRRAAFFAAALYAVSPLAVRLSPSLLTDPLLVLCMMVGLWAGLNRRSWLTGIACGLALATKQQAVLLIPLILAVYSLSSRLRHPPRRDLTSASPNLGSLLRLAGGFLLIFTIVLWWDSLRWQWMPSFWERSATAYGGLALAHGSDFPQQILQWGELLGYAFGWPLWALLVLSIGISLRRGRHRLIAFDQLLLAFIIVYLTVHLVTTMPPWDRYALPLVPLLALLLGRGLASLENVAQIANLRYILRTAAHALHAQPWMKTAGLGRRPARAVGAIFRTAAHAVARTTVDENPAGTVGDRPERYGAAILKSDAHAVGRTTVDENPAGTVGDRPKRYGAAILKSATRARYGTTALLVVIVVYTAWLATLSAIPVGDATAYDSAAHLSEHVRQTQPPGAILYHHWLGWHYGFYLANTPVDLKYWESAADLAVKAGAHSQKRQLIAFPAGRDQRGAQQALALAGLRLQPELAVFHQDGALSASLYRIVPADSQTGDPVAVGASPHDK